MACLINLCLGLIFLMAEIKALSSEIPIPLNSINSELNAFPSIPSPIAKVVSIVTRYLVGAVAVISLVKILISPEIINLLFIEAPPPPIPFLLAICPSLVTNNFRALGNSSRISSEIKVFNTILAASSLFPKSF